MLKGFAESREALGGPQSQDVCSNRCYSDSQLKTLASCICNLITNASGLHF